MTTQLIIQRFKRITLQNREAGRIRVLSAFVLSVPGADPVLLNATQALKLVDCGAATIIDEATAEQIEERRQQIEKRRKKKQEHKEYVIEKYGPAAGEE